MRTLGTLEQQLTRFNYSRRTVEFKLPVYPRTYEFLITHPGARGTCSKKDNEFSIGVS